MSSTVRIRPALPEDLPAVGRLGALLVRMHHDFDPGRFLAASPATERAYGAFLGRQLEEPESLVLVAEREGEVVGYTYSGLEGVDYMLLRGPGSVLHDIFVDPDHRGHGIGSMLLQATLAAMKERGGPQFTLSTAVRNEAAQRLFAHAGFRSTMIEMTLELGEASG